ncbi:Beta-lactamase class C and other penicillin binding protein [Altererythrobacter epoxidivorans]|uniref:Beta-lactamase class C and other penicillin binding protein n=1 Tax=Altererythrobacter epoxidivorans TaxID=361183 RepID=A0A0M4M4V7_9SPHN|nr:serine hydrolase domain-containing protein [Altererythrobacter epoxidivorans]ALE16915.1 Beta-lactamase class C and other penicillin binding protein [Altererythrobacter epoxidivorans]
MAFRTFESVSISRRSLFRSSAYLAAGGAMATLPFGRELLASDAAASWPAVTAKINEYVAARKIPNMVAAFGWGDEEPQAISRGKLRFGQAPQADMDSLYRVYSMTKPITGMAAMMLISDGKLGLDQPIADFIPGFANMRVLKKADGPLDDTVPADRPITARHLMTHTAGLGYDIVTKGPLLDAYRKNGIVGGQVSRIPLPGQSRTEPAPGLAAFADRVAKLPLIAQPGTEWSYSIGLDVLGRVIEVASGQSFESFLQDRMFGPAGMTSTFFRVPESEVDRFTDNYGILNGMPLPMDPAKASIYLDKPPIHWGGSGLVMSPRDYDRFLKMVLGYGKIDGKRVMSEPAVRVGTSNLLPKAVNVDKTWIAGQGFGAGGRVVGQTYGWGGAAGTLGSVDFGSGLRAGLFVQYMPSDAFPIRDEFLAALEADMKAMKGKAI